MGEHHPALAEADARALAERVAAAMYSRDTASKALGIRIAEVSPGHAELTMPVRADMLNGHAICHGGFIFTLADSAFACGYLDGSGMGGGGMNGGMGRR